MEETNEPRILEPAAKPNIKLPFKWTELALITVFLAVFAALGLYLINRTRTNHEVNEAKLLSAQVVNALAKQNTVKLHSLGDKNFQATNSAAQLDSQLRFKTTPPITFGAMYGDTKPIIDTHMVLNNSRGQHVVFIYRYDKLKVPFYVRIDTIKPPHDSHWRLQALGASNDESNLTSPLPAGASSV